MITITPAAYKDVEFFEIKNKNGASLKLTNLGATVTSIKMPDKNGDFKEIALGYDEIAPYLTNPNYFGSSIGRYANRIACGKFRLNGKEYELTKNEGKNTLHGGIEGISKRVFEARPLEDEVIFRTLSPDGDQGFPGNLDIKISYKLTPDNAIIITYDASCDKDTIINLTNHTYFNLNGCTRDILNNTVEIKSELITETDDTLIPTGKLIAVSGTPYDLNKPALLSDRIPARLKGGFDINYVITGEGFRYAAYAYSPLTHIKMTVSTDQPAVQFYTAGALAEGTMGREGQAYGPFYGLCLETQNYPDAVNHPEFPNCILNANESYHSITEYKFSAE